MMDGQSGLCENLTVRACRKFSCLLSHVQPGTSRRWYKLATGLCQLVSQSTFIDACCVPSTVLVSRETVVKKEEQRDWEIDTNNCLNVVIENATK